ncbi:MAG: prepilin-type N-terminal cleavage/methylation domain-containing protein [Sedimentisphaerales bacterium]|nr:prepilin-type N-terminal cleavage/methylation domain-containing protein [Sedimentisphaerales bacterium]
MKRFSMVGFIKQKRGFSLAEIMVALLLVSLLAITIGLSLHKSHERTTETKAALTRLEQTNTLFRILSDELRWATEIRELFANRITFTLPRQNEMEPVHTITFYWDAGDLNVYRYIDYANPVIVFSGISEFMIFVDKYEISPVSGQWSLYNLVITMRSESDYDTLISRNIELQNVPTWL